MNTGLLPRRQIVALIANRVRARGDGDRQTSDKVSHRIKYAIDTGRLRIYPGNRLDLVQVDEWARDKWPEYSKGANVVHVRPARVAVYGLRACVFNVPNNLPEAKERIIELEKMLDEKESELSRLRPKAKEWDALCEKNRQNARQPRGK